MDYVFGFEQQPLHRRWQKGMSSHKKLVIVGPRNHGKCLAEGEHIHAADGRQVPVEEWKGGDVLAMNPETLQIGPAYSPAATTNGVHRCVRITTQTGRRLTTTLNHPFLVGMKWVLVSDIQVGDRVGIMRGCDRSAEGQVVWDKVVSIEDVGDKPTWAIEVPGPENFVAQGFITHNTSQCLGRILWELGNDPNLRIKLFCQSDSKACERIDELAEHIKHNAQFREVFPWVSKSTRRQDWSKHKLTIHRTRIGKDVTVEGLGILSSATGGRADLIIADDVVDYRNAIVYPKAREQLKKAWKEDISNLLEPDGRIWYIATPWHQADLTAELRGNPQFAKMFDAIDENLTPLWPDKWPTKSLEDRREEIGTFAFSRAFHCKAVSDDETPIKPHWIRFYDSLPGNRLALIKTVDPAIKKGVRNDYSMIATWLITDTWDLYLTRLTRERYIFPELYDRILREAAEDHPDKIIVESISGFAAIAQQLVAKTPLHVEEVPSCPDKFTKAHEVGFYAEQGNIWIPGVDGKPAPHVDIFFEELTLFPVADHDESVDVTWMALRAMRDMMEPPEMYEETGDDHGGVFGW